MSAAATSTHRLTPLLEPRSIAVIGASTQAHKQSSRPLLTLRRYGFPGPIHPIHPSSREVMGYPAVPSMRAIGEPVDLTVVMLPAAAVPDALEDAAEAGNRTFIVLASGFAEQGETGARLEARVAAIVERYGLTLMGPNTNGLMHSHARLCATIATIEFPELPRGAISYTGQSGALASYWLQMLADAGFGFSKWIPTGNEVNLGLPEVIDYLAADPTTEILCVYLEGARDGPALRRALGAARRAGKAVVALRSGRSPSGAAATLSHTGAVAGEDRVWSALFEETGVVPVGSLTEMADAAKLFATRPRPARGRPVIMSVSGGAGAIMADYADAEGMTIAPIPPATAARLTAALPDFGKPGNPLDLTGALVVRPEILVQSAQVLAAEPGFDSFLLFLGLMTSAHAPAVASIANDLMATGKPLALAWSAAQAPVLAALRARQIPCYPDVPQAVRALGHWIRFCHGNIPAPDRHAAVLHDRPRTGRALTEAAGYAALGDIPGLRWPRAELVTTAGAARSALARLGLPLVAKLQSPALPHKSDHGAVQLGLRDEEAVIAAVDALLALAGRLGIPAEGVLLQEMVPHDFELLIGLRQDATFGPLLVVGRGGTDAETDPDVVLRLLPLSTDEIVAMLQRLRCSPRFAGSRGRAGIDLPALAQAIAALAQRYLDRADIVELEINPLAITGPDRFCGLDALVTVAAP